MPFEFFDHTGDIGVDLAASSLAGLFEAAADALADTLTDASRVERRARVTASLRAAAPDLLLADWVNELVFRFEAFDWLTREARVIVGKTRTGWALDACLDGERRSPDRHPLKVLVKAVTYHELRVVETDGAWQARMVFDV